MRHVLTQWVAGFALLLIGALAHADNDRDYQLAPGDIIKISVYQNPDLTLETRISESGTITYPLIGLVNLGGQTLEAAEKKIAKALQDRGFIRQAQVNIRLLQVLGNQFSVLGQVKQPGRFPLETANTRVTDALALAGGIAENGSDVAILTGTRDGKPFRREIDIASLFLDDRAEGNVYITGGDTIYVHRAPVFYIYGEVQRAGAYRVERGMTIMQGLAQGGGPTLRGSEKSLRVFRRNKDNVVEQLKPASTDLLQVGDVLHVPEGLF